MSEPDLNTHTQSSFLGVKKKTKQKGKQQKGRIERNQKGGKGDVIAL